MVDPFLRRPPDFLEPTRFLGREQPRAPTQDPERRKTWRWWWYVDRMRRIRIVVGAAGVAFTYHGKRSAMVAKVCLRSR